MQPPSLPSRNRNRGQPEENACLLRNPPRKTPLVGLALWAILAACGRPTWAGGIHANLAWSPRGVRVVEVPDGGAAFQAGLQPEDRLVLVDGRPVAGLSGAQVHELLMGEVGTHVELVVLRDEQPVKLRVERVPYEQASK
jgi:S1-C subfamily serine protease